MLKVIFYIPFICFIAIGLYRSIRYGAKEQLWSSAVGLFGIIVLFINDYGNSFFNASPSERIIYDIVSASLDAILAAAVVFVVISEWRRK
jgi:hypothetical protein